MVKLLQLPDQTGYGVLFSGSFITAKLTGGLSRLRLDKVGAPDIINLQWTLSPEGYESLLDFFENTTNRGVDYFEIDLILDSAALKEYEVKFVPGTFKLTDVFGQTHRVSAQLEVQPRVPDVDADESMLLIRQLYGDEAPLILNLLEKLANWDLV